MLQPIDKALTQEQRVHALLSRPYWVAICPDTGAFLSGTGGRVRAGSARHYILILPKEAVEERGGLLNSYTFRDEERVRFRAFSLDEAIEKGNKKLAKMLEKRGSIPDLDTVIFDMMVEADNNPPGEELLAKWCTMFPYHERELRSFVAGWKKMERMTERSYADPLQRLVEWESD